MRIAKVIGKVTLSKSLPSFKGAILPMVVPQSSANLMGEGGQEAEPIVVYDELCVGAQSLIAMSEGAEAAQPFRPEIKPVDAYNAAILDHVEIECQVDNKR